MYKLITADLDGTLLNSYGVVTEYNKSIIKQLKNIGIEFVIASGRPTDSIKTIAKEIECENYFISGNGAILYDAKNNQILYENTINKNKILEIIKICEENSIFYNIYTEREVIAKSLNYNVLYYHKENISKDEDNKTHINIIENIYEYILNREEKIIKMTICDSHKSVFNAIIKKIKLIEGIEVLDVSHMSRKIIKQGTEEIPIEYFYTEISAKNVDKWNAIQCLADKLGIKINEIIAIGDNINDLEMIKNAGLGIAMKGSTPILTSSSKYITKYSNNEDGVGQALKEIILDNNII